MNSEYEVNCDHMRYAMRANAAQRLRRQNQIHSIVRSRNENQPTDESGMSFQDSTTDFSKSNPD